MIIEIWDVRALSHFDNLVWLQKYQFCIYDTFAPTSIENMTLYPRHHHKQCHFLCEPRSPAVCSGNVNQKAFSPYAELINAPMDEKNRILKIPTY